MKITGIALIIIATCILAMSTFVAIDADFQAASQENRPTLFSDRALVIPLITAAIMGGMGVLLLLYGGRGYAVVRHPDIQPVESREITNSVHTIEGR